MSVEKGYPIAQTFDENPGFLVTSKVKHGVLLARVDGMISFS